MSTRDEQVKVLNIALREAQAWAAKHPEDCWGYIHKRLRPVIAELHPAVRHALECVRRSHTPASQQLRYLKSAAAMAERLGERGEVCQPCSVEGHIDVSRDVAGGYDGLHPDERFDSAYHAALRAGNGAELVVTHVVSKADWARAHTRILWGQDITQRPEQPGNAPADYRSAAADAHARIMWGSASTGRANEIRCCAACYRSVREAEPLQHSRDEPVGVAWEEGKAPVLPAVPALSLAGEALEVMRAFADHACQAPPPKRPLVFMRVVEPWHITMQATNTSTRLLYGSKRMLRHSVLTDAAYCFDAKRLQAVMREAGIGRKPAADDVLHLYLSSKAWDSQRYVSFGARGRAKDSFLPTAYDRDRIPTAELWGDTDAIQIEVGASPEAPWRTYKEPHSGYVSQEKQDRILIMGEPRERVLWERDR